MVLAARIGDMHVCPMITPGTPPVPHVGGPIIMGAPTVLTVNLPQARIGDQCTCVGPPDVIVAGCPTVLVCNVPAARVGDATAHGGMIVAGAPTVLIGVGGAGGGGGGGGAGSMAGGGAGAAPGGVPQGQAVDSHRSGSAAQGLPEGPRGQGAATDGRALSSQPALPAPAHQAQALRDAAASGTPFCEACARAAAEAETRDRAAAEDSALDGGAPGGTGPATGPAR